MSFREFAIILIVTYPIIVKNYIMRSAFKKLAALNKVHLFRSLFLTFLFIIFYLVILYILIQSPA